MPSDALMETVPAERLGDDVANRVAARLAPGDRSQAGAAASASGSSASATARPDAPRALANDRERLLEAVRGALADRLGSSQVFILQDMDPAVASVISAVIEQLPTLVASRRQALSERNIEALVDVFLGVDPLAAAMPAIERDNAAAQADFLKRWPVLTADAVAGQAEHGSANRSATASRWKKARRIFGIRAAGREVYPAFQFQEGRPRPVMGKVLAALPPGFTGWQTAFWFTGPNGWLDGQAPVERLRDEAAVVAAADRERDAWMG
jgi:hypothetical protein